MVVHVRDMTNGDSLWRVQGLEFCGQFVSSRSYFWLSSLGDILFSLFFSLFFLIFLHFFVCKCYWKTISYDLLKHSCSMISSVRILLNSLNSVRYGIFIYYLSLPPAIYHSKFRILSAAFLYDFHIWNFKLKNSLYAVCTHHDDVASPNAAPKCGKLIMQTRNISIADLPYLRLNHGTHLQSFPSNSWLQLKAENCLC